MTPDDITELFGARCAEFDPDCACCRVWQQQDEIERLQRLVDDNDARSVHTCHDHCQRLECVQRLEIERLREVFASGASTMAQATDEIERLRDWQRRAIDLLTLGYDPPCEEYHPECPGCQAHDLIGGAQS